MLVNKIKITFIFFCLKLISVRNDLNKKQIPSDYCDNLIRPIRIVTKAPIVNEGLMDDDPENEAEPVLQLFDEQHDVTRPAVVEPVEEAVHVVPDGTHVYTLDAVPAAHVETVLK